MTDERAPWLWALVSCLLCVGVCQGALDGIPHVSDEVVYTLQARLFAHGMRTGPPADVSSMMTYPFWVTGPESRAAFPVGWPLLLAVGERLRLAWMVNPILAGLSVVLTYRVGRPLVGARAALLGCIVVAVCPALVLLGASRMSHTSVLVGLLLGTWALVDPGSWKRWLVGGLGIAYTVLARPFDALLLGGVLLGLGAVRLLRAGRWQVLWAWGAPAAMAAAAVLVDNAWVQGDPWLFPADAFYADWVPERPGCNRLGFGADVGCVAIDGSFGHSVEDALGQALDRALLLDRLLVGVPLVGGLAVCAAVWKRPLLLLPLGLVAGGHLLYWSPGLAYGPRFWALGIPGLALALGVFPGRNVGRWFPWACVVAACIGIGRIWPDLSDRYWCVDGRLSEYVQQRPEERGILLVRATGNRATGWPRLGVERFTCDPMLEFGDALVFWDPVDGAWQPRHALSDPSQTALYRRQFGAGRPAFRVVHDVTADEREVFVLPALRP